MQVFFLIRHLLDLNQWNIALQAIALPLCQDAIATYDRDARIQAPRIGRTLTVTTTNKRAYP